MQSQDSAAAELFAGRGETAEYMREFPWETTALGPVEGWPQSLKTAIRIMITSRQPIWIGWGPELIYLYNDPYKSIIGARHPWAVGKPVKEVWHEIWRDIGPMLATAMSGTEGTYVEEQLLLMERNGYPEETYYTFSHSPIPGDDNRPGGIICANTDDTRRVIGERQLALLRHLAAQTADTQSWQAVCKKSVAALATNSHDLPFALLYLQEESGKLVLSGVAGLESSHPAAVAELTINTSPWPLERALLHHQDEVVAGLAQRFSGADLPSGAWHQPPSRAVVLPITPTGETGRAGVLVVGLNPFRLYDSDYQGFLLLAAGQISAALANAQAYEQERRRAEALAEIDKAKTIFFSNVSHEFRTPLTLMLGPLQQALENRELPESVLADLTAAHRNGLRLLKLVNSLLDFSRVEAGRMQALFTPEDLATLTADLASNFRSACERAGLALTVECQPLSEPVFIDRDMWEKIIFNLLSNAFKFTLQGGISLHVGTDNGMAQVIVSDTGVGIPEEALPHVFERFHRIEESRGRSHEGTGIGLALVRELVRQHGGTIEVASSPDIGTTFTIRIPFGRHHLPAAQVGVERAQSTTAARAQAFVEEALRWLPESVSAAPTVPAGIALQRIVLADDNADMRQYIQRILGEQYDVVAVADGEAALAQIELQRPDLVLSDVMMPRLDGFGLLKALKTAPETSDLPVILLSARAGDEAEIEGLDAGADAYLIKPFQARELKARVRSLLAKDEARREQESHFRMVADKAPIILWTTDADGACTYLSQQWYEFTGGTRAQDLGYEWIERIHPLDQDIARATFIKAIRERAPFRLEYRLRGRDGHYSWMIDAGTPRFDEAGRFVGQVGCVFDIAERRRMEAILDAQKNALELSVGGAPLRQILEVFVQAVETQSSAGVRASILLVDESGKRLVCGAAPNLPQALRDTFEGLTIGPDSALCGTVARLREPLVVRDVLTDPRCAPYREIATAHTIHACWSTPVFSTEGALLAVIALYYPHTLNEVPVGDAQMVEILGSTAALIIDKTIDTRLRREAEQKLRASEAALREADKRKDEFLATLAHELRNPLAPISNALQIMRLSPDAAAFNDMRDLINRQLAQMVRLVDDLMDVSRITRGKVELRRERISLVSVIQNTVEVVRPLVDERGQTLRVHLPDQPIWLNADFTRLSQVFINIVNNACKYTQAGGAIDVTATLEDGEVTVVVEDNGMGIPADKLPLIFEMFSQVEDPLGRSHGGLGIGLTLAEQLVKMHQGKVEAHSDGPGKGARFSVHLPLAVDPGAIVVADGRANRRASATLRVLVVDDNRESAKTLGQLIELLGHQAHVAFDGAEALALAEQMVPHLVLMDIGMPGMNGYETCQAMKRMPALKDTLMVAQTGWSEKRHNLLSQEAGFAHHLVKPVDLQALERLLAEAAATRMTAFSY